MGLVLLLGATGLAASLLGGDAHETTGGVTVRFTEVGVVPPAAPPTSWPSGANTVRPQPRPGAGQDNLPEGIEDGWIPRLAEVQAGAAPAKDDVRLLGASTGAPVSSLRDDFLAGYDAAGGPEQYRLHFVEVEDGWRISFSVSKGKVGAARLAGQPLVPVVPTLPAPLGNEAVESDGRAAFVAGYRFANGPPALETHFTDVVLPCEWTDPWGTPWYAGNGYLSVGQFHPDTWERAGGGDPNDLWTVGRNVANWLNLGVEPGGTGGWPTCWWK